MRRRIEKDDVVFVMSCCTVPTSGCVVVTEDDVSDVTVFTHACGVYMGCVGVSEAKMQSKPYKTSYMHGEYPKRSAPSTAYSVTKLVWDPSPPHALLGGQHFGYTDVDRRTELMRYVWTHVVVIISMVLRLHGTVYDLFSMSMCKLMTDDKTEPLFSAARMATYIINNPTHYVCVHCTVYM